MPTEIKDSSTKIDKVELENKVKDMYRKVALNS